MNSKLLQNEAGNIPLLFSFVVLPLLFVGGVLAVDLSRWASDQNYAQREADRLSQLAATALPNSARAEQLVHSNVKITSQMGYSVAATDSSVEVTVNGSTFLGLTSLMEERFLDYQQRSVARLLPSNTAILFVDGQSLRPQSPSDTSDALQWGNSAEFPNSTFYNSVAPPLSAPSNAPWDWISEYDNYRRWATLGCFNKQFSAVKEAAMRITAALLMNSTNKVSVGVTPGSQTSGGYKEIRSIEGTVADDLLYDMSPAYMQSTATCAAGTSVGFNPSYALPTNLRAYDSATWCDEPINIPATFPTLPGSCAQLSVFQRIYYESAELTADPDLPTAITRSLANVLLGNSNQPISRGNLQGRGRIIAISDFLPTDRAALNSAISNAAREKVRLDILLLQHAHANLPSHAEMHDFRSELEAAGLPSFSLHLVSSEAELVEVTAPLIAERERTVVISK